MIHPTNNPLTPRTNEATWVSQGGNAVVTVDFAQKLELEIAELKSQMTSMMAAVDIVVEDARFQNHDPRIATL